MNPRIGLGPKTATERLGRVYCQVFLRALAPTEVEDAAHRADPRVETVSIPRLSGCDGGCAFDVPTCTGMGDMETIGSHHPLRRLFAGLVEHAFCAEVGMCDPGLTNYVADLLVDFTHIDRLNAIQNAQDKDIEQVAAMLAVAMNDEAVSSLERDRAVFRRIGDYTLFWAGVYPEHLKQCSRYPSDVLIDYVSKGKRSYAIVAQLGRDDDNPSPALFRHLSEDFEFCLHGLNIVRRSWESSSRSPKDGGADLIF